MSIELLIINRLTNFLMIIKRIRRNEIDFFMKSKLSALSDGERKKEIFEKIWYIKLIILYRIQHTIFKQEK